MQLTRAAGQAREAQRVCTARGDLEHLPVCAALERRRVRHTDGWELDAIQRDRHTAAAARLKPQVVATAGHGTRAGTASELERSRCERERQLTRGAVAVERASCAVKVLRVRGQDDEADRASVIPRAAPGLALGPQADAQGARRGALALPCAERRVAEGIVLVVQLRFQLEVAAPAQRVRGLSNTKGYSEYLSRYGIR